MTTQEVLAFVQRGYDAYNTHQTDPHWLIMPIPTWPPIAKW